MEVAVTQDEAPWTAAQKILFRFLGVYLFIYVFPFPLDLIPFISGLYSKIWDAVVPWVGESILRISYDITVKPNGSGDTTYNYVQVFIFFALAGLVTIVWTLADSRRAHYRKLYFWLRVLIRYYLAFIMLSYGFAKVIKNQFPDPGFERLLTTYGDSSPMGLLWTFMGYSTLYNFFTGMGEVAGGLLLFFRRTTTLGALLIIGVMGNVALLNYAYDIPVKLFSTHLVLMAVFLLVPDLWRLIRFFVLNQAVPPANVDWPFRANRRLNQFRVGLKALLIAGVLIFNTADALQLQRQWGDKRPRPPLYGLYEVTRFVRNNETIPPLVTDTTRWQNLIVSWPGRASIRRLDGRFEYYSFEPDTLKGQVAFFIPGDTLHKSWLTYQLPAPDSLVLAGKLREDSVRILMRKIDPGEFLLISRGFNWINEYPLNK